jgi:UDP-N-acetylglucosamine 2-epimerase
MEAVFAPHVRPIEPVSYFDMMMLEENARLIATDSGGVQREAYFLGVPCLTLRDETEWVETVEAGWNKLVGVDPDQVVEAWSSFSPPAERPSIFGDGTAAQGIADILNSDAVPFGLPRNPNVKIERWLMAETGVTL